MRICIGTCAYIASICAITELRTTKVIDSIKDKANKIIIIKKKYRGKQLVNFFANIEAMFILLSFYEN